MPQAKGEKAAFGNVRRHIADLTLCTIQAILRRPFLLLPILCSSIPQLSALDPTTPCRTLGRSHPNLLPMVQRTKTDGKRHDCCATRLHTSCETPHTGPSQAEQLLRVTSGIAAELIRAHDANESVSLNELRARLSKKFGYGGVPRLVDIISAIPDDYKKALLPNLRARPIRTASGVRPPPSFRTPSALRGGSTADGPARRSRSWR